MDTRRNLNIIRCQFKMIIDKCLSECQKLKKGDVLAECRNGEDVEGADLQKLVNEYVQQHLKQPEIFWQNKITDINKEFETLYKKLMHSFSSVY